MSKDTSLLDQLTHELGEAAASDLGLELIHYTGKFIQSSDPNWVDLMVWRLTSEGQPLPLTIQAIAARIAHRRLLGAGSRNKSSKVIREHARDLAMRVMAHQRGMHPNLSVAAEHACSAVMAICGFAPPAGRLEKEFRAYSESHPVIGALRGYAEVEAGIFPEERDALESEIGKLPKRHSGKRR